MAELARIAEVLGTHVFTQRAERGNSGGPIVSSRTHRAVAVTRGTAHLSPTTLGSPTRDILADLGAKLAAGAIDRHYRHAIAEILRSAR